MLIILAVLVFACLIIGLLKTYPKVARLLNPYSERELSGPVTLSKDWIEIEPKPALVIDRPVQEIVLELDKSIEVNVNTFDLVLPDGSLASPKVELVDQAGTVYDLSIPSAAKTNQGKIWLRGYGMGIQASSSLPRTTAFSKVRVRSDSPVFCSKILWRTYDPRDLK